MAAILLRADIIFLLFLYRCIIQSMAAGAAFIPVTFVRSQSIKFQVFIFPLLWSSIFVTLMANKIGGLQFGIYRNCQISSRVFHTAVAALPLTKANRSDFE